MDRVRPYLGLSALAAGALFSFFRIFSTNEWVVPVFAAGLGGLAVTAGLARLRLAGPIRTLLAAMAGVWFLALFIVPKSLKLGLPDIGRLIRVARFAWLHALDATTLLKPEPGILLLICAGAWAGVLISEPVATAGRPFLASLPWIGLFALTSAAGASGGRSIAVVVFIIGLLAGLFSIRMPGPEQVAAKPLPHHPRAQMITAGWAGVLGAIATLSGVSLAAAVPGSQSLPWLSGQLQGPSSQTVISPLVQIKPQLLDQRRTKLFEVKAGVPAGSVAYWRLMALDEFDGNAWGSSAEYRKIDGPIPYRPSEVFRGRRLSIRQSYRIEGLGSPWLPAAYQPTKIAGTAASVDLFSSSIIARPRINKGTAYQVTSNIPDPFPDDLKNVPPARGVEQYTKLSGVSDAVRKIAESWTSGKQIPYDKVVAISDRLRRFRYDENVPAGHSADQLLFFLTKSKAGYCEQFAASMAVLARSIGVPARVAVGFLPGAFDDAQRSYTVTTHDAHAWPEVYFEGVGWVPFEPTPRSGVSPPVYATATAPAEAIQEQEARAQQEQPAPQPPEPTLEPSPPTPRPPASRESKQDSSKWWARLISAASAALFILGALAFVKRSRGRSRYRRALTTAERIKAAFLDFEDRAIDLSKPRKITQTPAEFVEEVRSGFRLDPGASAILIGSFERAVFSAGQPTDIEASEALAAATLLSSQLWARTNWVGRLGLLVSPRSLLMRAPR